MVEQRRHHPPALLDAVLASEALAVPDQRGVQQHLVRRRALAALLGELHVEADLLRFDGSCTLRLEQAAGPGRGIELDDQLARLRSRASREAEPRRQVPKTTRSSVCVAGRHFPVRMKNGTPDQRQLSISSRSAAYVSVVESGATPSIAR